MKQRNANATCKNRKLISFCKMPMEFTGAMKNYYSTQNESRIRGQ